MIYNLAHKLFVWYINLIDSTLENNFDWNLEYF